MISWFAAVFNVDTSNLFCQKLLMSIFCMITYYNHFSYERMKGGPFRSIKGVKNSVLSLFYNEVFNVLAYFCNHLPDEERAGCLTFIVFLLLRFYPYYMPLSCSAVGLSVVCGWGISSSCSLFSPNLTSNHVFY